MTPEMQLQLQLFSNVVSIIICIGIAYIYFQQKKRLDYIEKLEESKNQGLLTEEEKKFIIENEKIYKEKALKAQANIKIYNPVYILIVGIMFTFIPFSEAILQLNVVVVSYIFIQIDKNNKNNCYTLFYKLKEQIKSAEEITN